MIHGHGRAFFARSATKPLIPNVKRAELHDLPPRLPPVAVAVQATTAESLLLVFHAQHAHSSIPVAGAIASFAVRH